MKTLFFIAALAGAVYLIMQTPAGKAWLQQSEPESNVNKVEQISTQVAQSVENEMTEFAQRLSQQQQSRIDQLENRIAELENKNEFIMGRIADKQQQSVPSGVVTLHAYKQAREPFVAQPNEQGFEGTEQTTDTQAATSDNQLQRNRQARLQDIAQKMEMSSLQALVN